METNFGQSFSVNQFKEMNNIDKLVIKRHKETNNLYLSTPNTTRSYGSVSSRYDSKKPAQITEIIKDDGEINHCLCNVGEDKGEVVSEVM